MRKSTIGQFFGSFAGLFATATDGKDPYPYQLAIAEQGLPEALAVPTGAGKTAAAVLGWLYRRRFHLDSEVRTGTPRWLVYVLPMRVLVEQVLGFVEEWLDRLGLDGQVGVHRVMGGEGRLGADWRRKPEQDAVFVGTLDMVTSRQLNRGYGEGRFVWPIDFGLFNNGCQFVYDEVQLMGPALPTSRQLHGLRRRLGTAMESSATWMSATIDLDQLRTVDAPEIEAVVGLEDADRKGSLAQRLEAPKVIRRVPIPDGTSYVHKLCNALLAHHAPGTLSLAIFNTVERARDVFLRLRAESADVETILLHSRFRPPDRRRQVDAALAPVDGAGPGRIVVSTQVVEAGVDVSARLMFTEAAPWPSIVQRSGRCNRDGAAEDAVLLWAAPPSDAPYEEGDVAAATAELSRLEGAAITADTIGRRHVEGTRAVYAVLRRKDLLELFDTLPDLTGTDIDVAQFIREGDDLDVEVAWRTMGSTGPTRQEPAPGAQERCPVPIGELRRSLKKRKGRTAWRFDHLAERWVAASASDLRPGSVLLLAADAGGYSPETGWDPGERGPVPELEKPVVLLEETAQGVGDDPLTFAGRWVALSQHLADVEAEVRRILDDLDSGGLTPQQRETAALAGRYHDLGKVHPSFQEMLLKTVDDESERARLETQAPWAKSARGRGPRNKRPYFRHELASTLALLDHSAAVLTKVPEPDLLLYLVAAHHGRVRLAFRPLPEEVPVDGRARALGIDDGEVLPSVALPDQHLPSSRLDLSVMSMGDTDKGPSWTARMLALRDRPDLGPFRLGWLEALVRVADWIASASYASYETPRPEEVSRA
ncbi:MAG: type I-G CRISPR-associated helicase/endonuclease Cas3g [Acidimicrobiia bacterium]